MAHHVVQTQVEVGSMTSERYARIGAARQETPLSSFRCAGCGYGASCKIAPERCPMCGGSAWKVEDMRPFNGHSVDSESPLSRENPLRPSADDNFLSVSRQRISGSFRPRRGCDESS